MTFSDVRVVRAKELDVELPDPDPLLDHIGIRERYCLLHAFGASHGPYRAGFRDYYFTRIDDPVLCVLEICGLVKRTEQLPRNTYDEDMTYFILTPFGRHVALSATPTYR